MLLRNLIGFLLFESKDSNASERGQSVVDLLYDESILRLSASLIRLQSFLNRFPLREWFWLRD